MAPFQLVEPGHDLGILEESHPLQANKMPRQSEGGTLIEATIFCHNSLFFARVNAPFHIGNPGKLDSVSR